MIRRRSVDLAVCSCVAILSLVLFPMRQTSAQAPPKEVKPIRPEDPKEGAHKAPGAAEKKLFDKYPALKPKQLKANEKDDELKKKLVERYTVAVEEMDAYLSCYQTGTSSPGARAPLENFLDVLRLVSESRLDLIDSAEEEIAIRKEIVGFTKQLEDIVKAKEKSGKSDIGDLARAIYLRADAEIALIRAERKLKK